MTRESLWTFLRREHPLLARALYQAHHSGLDSFDPSRIGASRRYVWECLEGHKPELAAMLRSEGFTWIKSHFSATVNLRCLDVCQAIAANVRSGAIRSVA